MGTFGAGGCSSLQGGPPGVLRTKPGGVWPLPGLPSRARSPWANPRGTVLRRPGDKVMFMSGGNSERGGDLGPLPVSAPLPSGSVLPPREVSQQRSSRFCFCCKPAPLLPFQGPGRGEAGAQRCPQALGGQGSRLDGAGGPKPQLGWLTQQKFTISPPGGWQSRCAGLVS